MNEFNTSQRALDQLNGNKTDLDFGVPWSPLWEQETGSRCSELGFPRRIWWKLKNGLVHLWKDSFSYLGVAGHPVGGLRGHHPGVSAQLKPRRPQRPRHWEGGPRVEGVVLLRGEIGVSVQGCSKRCVISCVNLQQNNIEPREDLTPYQFFSISPFCSMKYWP